MIRNKAYFLLSILLLLGLSSLFLMVHYFSETSQELIEPSLIIFRSFLTKTPLVFGLEDKLFLLLKLLSLALALLLIIVSIIFISAVAGNICYKLTAEKYGYNPYPVMQTLIKTIEWNLYRFNYYAKPLIKLTLASFLIIGLIIIFFNPISAFAGFNLNTSFFVFVLIFTSIFFLYAILGVSSLWNFLSSVFGKEIASSEPDLDREKILDRSKNLIISSKPNIMIYITYLALIIAVSAQLKTALMPGAAAHLTSPGIVTALLLSNIFIILSTGYIRSKAYITALLKKEDSFGKQES